MKRRNYFFFFFNIISFVVRAQIVSKRFIYSNIVRWTSSITLFYCDAEATSERTTSLGWCVLLGFFFAFWRNFVGDDGIDVDGWWTVAERRREAAMMCATFCFYNGIIMNNVGSELKSDMKIEIFFSSFWMQRKSIRVSGGRSVLPLFIVWWWDETVLWRLRVLFLVLVSNADSAFIF